MGVDAFLQALTGTNAAIAAVLLLSAGVFYAVFKNMKPGFGPNNVRVVAIVMVASFTTLLGLAAENMTPAFGILGAIAGYVFGSAVEGQGIPRTEN